MMKRLILLIALAIASVANAADVFNTSDSTTGISSGVTINNANATGTWTTTGWTLPALTLGGTISGGGKNLNNIIIGAVTPLAGAFTTINGTNLTLTGTTVLGATASPLSNAACTAGQIYWDAGYLYLCTATGVVKRTAALTGGY